MREGKEGEKQLKFPIPMLECIKEKILKLHLREFLLRKKIQKKIF